MKSPFISIVINADTRSGFQNNETSATEMFNGCRSVDFLIDGVQNKINFFKDFEKEVILFIDQHEEIPENVLNKIRGLVDTLVIRKHDKKFGDQKNFANFNDLNYLSALQMARGEIMVHCDQDCAIFTKSKESVDELISMLDHFKFISYPSDCSPNAVNDPSFGGIIWASTRFFICKRETLKFDTLMNCIIEPEWMYKTFGDSPRRCNWLEHFLTKVNNNSCFYPAMSTEKRSIFCWANYKVGTLDRLNNMIYEDVKAYISEAGGIYYPCELNCK